MPFSLLYTPSPSVYLQFAFDCHSPCFVAPICKYVVHTHCKSPFFQVTSTAGMLTLHHHPPYLPITITSHHRMFCHYSSIIPPTYSPHLFFPFLSLSPFPFLSPSSPFPIFFVYNSDTHVRQVKVFGPRQSPAQGKSHHPLYHRPSLYHHRPSSIYIDIVIIVIIGTASLAFVIACCLRQSCFITFALT